MDGDMLICYVQVLSVGSNIMLIISMSPDYQMGYHLCQYTGTTNTCCS